MAVYWIIASTTECCQRGIQCTLSKTAREFADRHNNTQDKATSLYESAGKLVLKISKKKTRTMRANHVNKDSIQLKGEDIEDE